MDNSAALLVAVLCGAAGFFGLLFIKDKRERAFLMRLFFAAFALRLVFTFILYETGLINILGGADDTGWAGMWERSRYWETSGPDSIWTVYDPNTMRQNPGFDYFGAYFYYLLNMQSQMALSVVNCFLNALTVVVIYKAARQFFNERASSFVAWAAALMPSFLIWSALTIKETWLILFGITTFYAVWRFRYQRHPMYAFLYGALAAMLVVLTLGFRFYAAGFLLGGTVISLMCCRAQRPLRAAGYGLLILALLYSGLSALNVVHFDLASVTESRLEEANTFRSNISDPDQPGTFSAIEFDYDTTTPGGAAMMLLMGSVYLLLSPFPWQMTSLRQALALPDVLLWWWLVFIFIVPGIGYAWRRQPQLVLSLAAFGLPLFLLYAFMFGNVGLAYRQRAQLIPYLLLLTAAGYEKRQQAKLRGSSKKHGTRHGASLLRKNRLAVENLAPNRR